MLRILIFKDPSIVTNELEKILKKLHKKISVENILYSAKDAIAWLQSHKEPDIIFIDVILNEGTCSDVFKDINVSCPIFYLHRTLNEHTRANYINNSVDPLLKSKGVSCQEELSTEFGEAQHLYTMTNGIYQDIQRRKTGCDSFYQGTILCDDRDQIIPLSTDAIKYICRNSQITTAYTKDSGYIINKTLEQLMLRLNPNQFFRANRNYIIHQRAIQIITKESNRKLNIKLTLADSPIISISKDKAGKFKRWLEGTSES